MDALYYYSLIATIFIWIGFVRTGLGFGGAALGLPLLLLIDDRPVYWLAIIGLHLLFFSSITLKNRSSNVDWHYLRKSLLIILPPTFIGIFGLLTLPNDLIATLIYLVALVYGFMWLVNFKIKANSKLSDWFLLIFGGYITGTTLTGAPLLAAVFMQNVSKEQLRNTLFALWFILVGIKIITLISFGVDIDYLMALILIPVAFIGHVIGLRVHERISQNEKVFKHTVGLFLVIISLIALISVYFK